ncbi:MAG: hypothetical protein KJO69_02560 [Gammaproteobacteria bacterium]|nr:hypothetical protein [Gammaproteobacteria bacterium]
MSELVTKLQYETIESDSLILAEKLNDISTKFVNEVEELLRFDDEVSYGDYHSTKKILERMGVDFSNIPYGECHKLQRTRASEMLDGIRGVYNRATSIAEACERMMQTRERVVADNKPVRLPIDRTVELDKIDENLLKRQVKAHVKKCRAHLNSGITYEGDKYTVSREITVKATSLNDRQVTMVNSSEYVDWRNVINNAIEGARIDVQVYVRYRQRGRKVEENACYHAMPLIIWVNPDEAVHDMFAFNKL